MSRNYAKIDTPCADSVCRERQHNAIHIIFHAPPFRGLEYFLARFVELLLPSALDAKFLGEEQWDMKDQE